jgi:hypothetical protein
MDKYFFIIYLDFALFLANHNNCLLGTPCLPFPSLISPSSFFLSFLPSRLACGGHRPPESELKEILIRASDVSAADMYEQEKNKVDRKAIALLFRNVSLAKKREFK